jgi:hypothetical protein
MWKMLATDTQQILLHVILDNLDVTIRPRELELLYGQMLPSTVIVNITVEPPNSIALYIKPSPTHAAMKDAHAHATQRKKSTKNH